MKNLAIAMACGALALGTLGCGSGGPCAPGTDCAVAPAAVGSAAPALGEDKTARGPNLLQNHNFALPVPDMVTVQEEGFTRSNWVPGNADFPTAATCIGLWMCWGIPVAIPGWTIESLHPTQGIQIRSFFNGTYGGAGSSNRLIDMQLAGNGLSQGVANPSGKVVYVLVYKWSAFFGKRGRVDISLNGVPVATHKGEEDLDPGAGETADFLCSTGNYPYAEPPDDGYDNDDVRNKCIKADMEHPFAAEHTPWGLVHHGLQREKHVVVLPEVRDEVTLRLLSTARRTGGWAGIMFTYFDLSTSDKVKICHKGNTLEVENGQSVLDHLDGHGDSFGACDAPVDVVR